MNDDIHMEGLIFFEGLIENFYYDLPDFISNDGNNYEGILKELFALTGNSLSLNNFSSIAVDDETFQLNLVINNIDYEVFLDNSGYFDYKLILLLNSIIKETLPLEKRMFTSISGNMFDFAIAFISVEDEFKLVKKQKIFREEQWILFHETNQKYFSLVNAKAHNNLLPQTFAGLEIDNSKPLTSRLFSFTIKSINESGDFESEILYVTDFNRLEDDTKSFISGKITTAILEFTKTYDPNKTMMTIYKSLNIEPDKPLPPKENKLTFYTGLISGDFEYVGDWMPQYVEKNNEVENGTWRIKLLK